MDEHIVTTSLNKERRLFKLPSKQKKKDKENVSSSAAGTTASSANANPATNTSSSATLKSTTATPGIVLARRLSKSYTDSALTAPTLQLSSIFAPPPATTPEEDTPSAPVSAVITSLTANVSSASPLTESRDSIADSDEAAPQMTSAIDQAAPANVSIIRPPISVSISPFRAIIQPAAIGTILPRVHRLETDIHAAPVSSVDSSSPENEEAGEEVPREDCIARMSIAALISDVFTGGHLSESEIKRREKVVEKRKRRNSLQMSEDSMVVDAISTIAANAVATNEANAPTALHDENSAADVDDEEPVDQPRPQLRIIDGRLVVDANSLTITRETDQDIDVNDNMFQRIEEEDRIVTSASWSKKESSKRWSKDETKSFYDALRQWGTNFEVIWRLYFPARSRRQVKNKFNKEERERPHFIRKALLKRKRSPVDITTLPGANYLTGLQPTSEIRSEVLALKAEILSAAGSEAGDARQDQEDELEVAALNVRSGFIAPTARIPSASSSTEVLSSKATVFTKPSPTASPTPPAEPLNPVLEEEEPEQPQGPVSDSMRDVALSQTLITVVGSTKRGLFPSKFKKRKVVVAS